LKRFAAPLCVFSLGMDILKIAGMATSASIPEPLSDGQSSLTRRWRVSCRVLSAIG
jgi:hypothetical protein